MKELWSRYGLEPYPDVAPPYSHVLGGVASSSRSSMAAALGGKGSRTTGGWTPQPLRWVT